MPRPAYSGQFKRDVKALKKRGKDISKLKLLVHVLLVGGDVPRQYLDHPLKGRWRQSRELHIEPDWLLICTVTDDVVRFERRGRHSDLFQE